MVTVDKPITNEFIAGMQGGVPILGQMTKKCQVVKESTFVFNITLVQGSTAKFAVCANTLATK
ncbi:hypothetical protein HAALTHF_33870n [Vreelandella aquamarina]|nr:hypothetical protein HAALTHF_33870n [Halomonas axialensis]